jgi:tetratricopeptide (TPR) repeat protein
VNKVSTWRILVGWSIVLLASTAFAATAPELIAEADRLVQADDGSADSLRRAIELYDQAAQIDTRDATSQVKVAAASLELGTRIKDGALGWFQRGEQAARRAVALDPKSADGYFLIAANRGRATKLLPLWKVSPTIVGQLEKDLLRALALDPRHVRALHMEGMILYKTPAPLRVFLDGKKSDVERYLTSAIKADPSFAPARLDLAEYYLAANRPADARAQARAVLDIKADRSRRYKPAAEALLRRIPAS